MSSIRLNSISVKNYRSFKERQDFVFPDVDYKKPVAIIGYNNCGKTNLMNAILYCLQVNFVSKDTFTINDFHKKDIEKKPEFLLKVESSNEKKYDGEKYANLSGYHRLNIITDGDEISGSQIISLKSLSQNRNGADEINYQAFGALRYFNVFYINFHSIKEEMSTQKTSWGNLRSFLGKHIKKIIDTDSFMSDKKNDYEKEIDASTKKVFENSELSNFINLIRKNYSTNLRDDNCTVEFGLPKYEEIFLKMIFKVGLNGDSQNLIPIDHFGDGFISMFVMAIIQAIAESNTQDQCLFLFEEPESFLHENHQEYFYKTVLCGLAEKGHQVIYTTHSDRMIDPFDTKGLIRLEMGEDNQTLKKYNNIDEFPFSFDDEGEPINLSRYNEFVKTIEPNLNRILFSKKVLLLEGPNDVLVYKHAIYKKVLEHIETNSDIADKKKYADTFLNFENISIVCHHGKSTAIYLIALCKHFKIDYFVVNDWDFDESELNLTTMTNCNTIEDVKASFEYIAANPTVKSMITTNWNLIKNAGIDSLHFNIKKLETVIGYDKNDKSSLGIWSLLLSDDFKITDKLFPQSLSDFIGLVTSTTPKVEPDSNGDSDFDDVPF